MTGTVRNDPYRGYNLKLEIDGTVRAGFHECIGLNREAVESEAIKLPGVHKTGDVTLKRGVIGELDFIQWVKSALDGKTQRRNGSIVMQDEAGEEKARWNLRGAVPVKYTGPTLGGKGNDVAVETLVLDHEGLTKA